MAWNVGLLCVPVTVISCVDHNKSPSCWFRGLPGLHSKFQVLPCHQDLCSLQHLQSSRQKDIELEDVFQAWVAFRMSQSKMASRQDKWKQGKLNYIKLSLEDLGSVQLYNWESTHQVPAMDFPPITEIKAEIMSAKLVRRLEVHPFQQMKSSSIHWGFGQGAVMLKLEMWHMGSCSIHSPPRQSPVTPVYLAWSMVRWRCPLGIKRGKCGNGKSIINGG